MEGLELAIGETLRAPMSVIQSPSDDEARLYYRFYEGTLVGDKHLCVVVKISPQDAFVLTAYLTNKIKRGKQLWPTRE
jgi:hypothetical protein